MQTQRMVAKNLSPKMPDERKSPHAAFPKHEANPPVGRDILNPDPEQAVWDILQAAEDTDFLMSMAGDCAACGNFSPPTTPGAFIFWFEDEAEIQEAQAATYPDEAEKRLQYAAVLREVAGRLRDLGIEPAVPEKEMPVETLIPLTQVVPAPFVHSSLKQAAFDFAAAGG